MLTNPAGVGEEGLYEYKRNVLIQIIKQSGLTEAYYAFESGESHNDKGLMQNFNAKSLGREWYRRLFNGEKRIITTPCPRHPSALRLWLLACPCWKKAGVGTLCLNLGLMDITTFTNGVLEFDNIFLTRADGYIMANRTKNALVKPCGMLFPI